jgi:photosystem II stability/assembly factor-like uncharacterized protein
MKRSFSLLILNAFLLISCGDAGTSLVEQMDTTPLVNANVGMLIKSHNLAVTLTDEQTILGTGSGRVFETNNFFNSFQVSTPFENELTDIVYLTSTAIVRYEPPLKQFSDPITLYRSTDKGATWKKSIIPNIANDATRGFEVLRMQFINENQGLMLVNNWSNEYPSNTLVYKIDLDKSEAVVLGRIDGYQPMEMKFLNASHGYVLLKARLQNNSWRVYVSGTNDGGLTWSTPTPVDTARPYEIDIEVIDQNVVIVYEFGRASRSEDGGVSWEQIILTGYPADISFVNSSTGFAISPDGTTSKSTDGGATWQWLTDIEIAGRLGAELSKIHFYNESVGIAYGPNQLFFTENGGRSWDTLIYPFEYVTAE